MFCPVLSLAQFPFIVIPKLLTRKGKTVPYNFIVFDCYQTAPYGTFNKIFDGKIKPK